MSVWLLLLIYMLATARLTGLVVADDITAPIRGAVLSRLNPNRPSHTWFGDLISCQWCTSVWVAAITGPLSYWHIQAVTQTPSWADTPWLVIPLLVLTYSQVTGMLSGLGRG